MKIIRSSFYFISLLLLILSGCASGASFRGEAVEPPVAAAEIALPDHNGNALRVADLRGKVVVVAFGFTNCVNECPLTMAHIRLALDELDDGAANTQVVLVSTDPVRDTPQALKDFLGKFNPQFLGVGGTVEQLEKVWAGYGIMVEDGGETHSSLTYVIDKTGNLRLTFDQNTAPADIAHDLNILLAE
jgi:protein SCO1/2